jgi:isopenicillin N synthase-like dioxygenase
MLAARPKDPTWHRGYSSIGKEQVSQMVRDLYYFPFLAFNYYLKHQEFDPEKLAELRKVAPDFKESFDIGNSAPTARLTNIWLPEDRLPQLRGFRDDATKFFEEGCVLQKKVLTALAMGIPEVEDNFFDEYHVQHENQIRLLHYPGAPVEVFTSGTKGRVGAHTVCHLFFIMCRAC